MVFVSSTLTGTSLMELSIYHQPGSPSESTGSLGSPATLQRRAKPSPEVRGRANGISPPHPSLCNAFPSETLWRANLQPLGQSGVSVLHKKGKWIYYYYYLLYNMKYILEIMLSGAIVFDHRSEVGGDIILPSESL